jgi:hypothetical protein
MARRPADFQTIRSEGGLLPPDLLRRILDPKEKLDGTRPEDYGLPQGERLNEIIIQSWNRLRKHWAEFRAAAANLPLGEAGTGLTNDKLSLPLLRELGFGLLPTSAGPEAGGRTYAISRFFGPVPVHLIGCGLSLDRRAAGVRGAAAVNPHGLVQDILNRSPKHLWGIVVNGLGLRILRDSQALSRQSFLEFDLEAMFTGEVYSDFVLLWLVAHATRFAPREADRPDSCWLEQWTKLAYEQGTRALGDLRGGVEKALQILGEGLTGHAKNVALRDALRTGRVPLVDFHGQLLRVVYRLIFLFVAEDRTIDGQSLLQPSEDAETARLARERYAAHYSTSRTRALASEIKGSRHGDLWQQFQLLVGALSGDTRFAAAREHLALPALGSFLWDPASTAALNDADLTNHDFLEALRHLAFTRQGKVLRPVDYKNLGAEELGGVYESLLALTPQISADGARFTFAEFADNERRTSGSYYTPDSLVQCLLDSALDPVVEKAIKGKTGAEVENTILSLKICDPAVGSGHFLVGAAHRLARHLARVRALAQGESEPSPLLYQHALRDVIGRCLYGVDINPMSAELCRVSLWLEALEPHKPLSFLDHHIHVGNSLLGATPELIAAGLPDDAFTAIEGDEEKVCRVLKKRNRQEREGQRDMLHLMTAEPEAEYNSIAARTRRIDEAPDGTIDEIQRKAEQYRRHLVSPEYRHAQDIADAWCAAFVWRKQANAPADPPTTDTVRRLEADPNALAPVQHREVERLSREYQFFHWHLAVPEVFARGGFDCVLGNPPWERTAFEEVPYFASRAPEIAAAPTTALRQELIARLKTQEPLVHKQFLAARRKTVCEDAFFGRSQRYSLSSGGRTNTFALFADLASNLVRESGSAGLVIPTAIATDAPMQAFWNHLIRDRRVIALYDFENRGEWFPHVHDSYKFSLLIMAGTAGHASPARYAFFVETIEELGNVDRAFEMTAAELGCVNPNTCQPPPCRSRPDFELLLHISRGCEPFGDSHPAWVGLTSAGTSEAWVSATTYDPNKQGDCVPCYESKLMHQYDHRFATFRSGARGPRQSAAPEPSESLREDPTFQVQPRFLVPRRVAAEHLMRKTSYLGAIPCYRDLADNRSLRTMIATVVPFSGLLQPLNGISAADARSIPLVIACLNSFAADYVTRLKTPGMHVNVTIFNQLPRIKPAMYAEHAPVFGGSTRDWIVARVLELTYTAWDLASFAQECGWTGPPFCWNDHRRFLLRCELDAALFHFYLPAEASGDWRLGEGEEATELARLSAKFPSPREAVAYIMDTFPIVKRKDEEKWGNFRTKSVILEIYDTLAESIRTGQPYRTRLDPPAADERCCHPPRRAEIPVPLASARQPTDTARAGGRREGSVSPTDRHVLVLCRVIDKHRGTRHERTLGSVKAEKIAHVVESHLGVDLGREPKRLAAGPADFPHLKKVVHRAEHGFFAFKAEERLGGEGATFLTLNGFGKALHRYDEVFGEQAGQLDSIIELFLPMDTEQAEIVATLYAVWNDRLASGARPTDDNIIDEFLAWSPGKRRITHERLLAAISWMRERALVPTGKGRRTEPR